MFYIKEQLTENATAEIDLTGEVFTRCPDCGVEQEIDLVYRIKNSPDFDFYGMSICCESCTEKRQAVHENAQKKIRLMCANTSSGKSNPLTTTK